MSRRYPNRRHVEIDLTGERRRRRNLNRVSISIAALLALILLGTTVLPALLDTDADDPASPAGMILEPVEGATPVQVVRVIDGDTLEVRAADGEALTVRLYGVDTPEREEPCYDEAADRLRTLAGSAVQLLPDARLTDPFGRELRYVYASDGALIDATLVAEGFGRAWTEDGSLRQEIAAAEADARSASRGCLWQ